MASAAMVTLRLPDLVLGCLTRSLLRLFEAALDADDTLIEIYVGPLQGEQLTAAHPCSKSERGKGMVGVAA